MLLSSLLSLSIIGLLQAADPSIMSVVKSVSAWVAMAISIAALCTIFYKIGRWEKTNEAKHAAQDDKINGFGARVSSIERDHGVLEGVVSTLEGMVQRLMGLQEGQSLRINDYQAEVKSAANEGKHMRERIDQRLETMSIQMARLEEAVKNLGRDG